MIIEALTQISLLIEGAGLGWGDFDFDGSSGERQVMWAPVDPDALQEDGLKVSLDFQHPVRRANSVPAFSSPILKLISDNEYSREAGIRYVARTIYLHMYMRETRPDHLRKVYDLPTSYLVNEARLLNAVGLERNELTVLSEGIERGYTMRYDRMTFNNQSKMAIHSIWAYEMTYPVIVPEQDLETVFTAKRIHVVNQLEPVNEQEIDSLPLDLIEGAKETVIS